MSMCSRLAGSTAILDLLHLLVCNVVAMVTGSVSAALRTHVDLWKAAGASAGCACCKFDINAG